MTIGFGEFEIDLAARELRHGASQVTIEPKAFDVLWMLLEHRHRVVTKDELIDTVWQGRFISDSALSTAVKAARQAVGDDGRKQSVIRTLHGHGFRFVADVWEPNAGVLIDGSPVTPTHGPTNIKRRRRTLIGRDTEKEAIIAQLRDGQIVSIVGPGGAGKTSLAIDTAMDLQEVYIGGVWLCELAPVQMDQVESTVLGAIDLSAGAGPVDATKIAERFGDAPTLLILDNCEHVIEAAARLAGELFDLVPNLAMLITSREALEIPEENVIRLTGLDYDSKDGVAVEMFHRCAQQVTDLSRNEDSNELMRQITERLDGLPLAIELAAPQLASRTPAELLSALDDQLSVLATRRRRGEARHNAMDDAIAWSYDLLTPQQREALESLSVFSGAFTVQAAEAVCETDKARVLLHSLVGQSMVAFVPGSPTSRFRLLEPIRQFAHRQFAGERLEACEERHAIWFAKRGVELADALRGAGEIEACEALTAEWADFGRALAWGRDRQRADIAVAPLISLDIHLVWQMRFEAFGWIEAGVAACNLNEKMQAEADIVRSMGAWCVGELDQANALLKSSEAVLGDVFGALFMRFCVNFVTEDFAAALIDGQKMMQLAEGSSELKYRVMAPAFQACALAMNFGQSDETPALLNDVESELSRHDWPSGRCCQLLALVVTTFGRGAHAEFTKHRAEMEITANRCYAFWFNIAAAGMEPTQESRSKTDALTDLEAYSRNFSSAIANGDIILVPTILRQIVICLTDVGHYALATKVSGLIPSLRGLGAKGSMSPGYKDVVLKLRKSMSEDEFQALTKVGQDWGLPDVVVELEAILDG